MKYQITKWIIDRGLYAFNAEFSYLEWINNGIFIVIDLKNHKELLLRF